MKRYLTLIILSSLLSVNNGCKKRSSPTPASPTSKIKSGTYVWMGGGYSYPMGSDVFIEFPVTVLGDSSVLVSGDTLPYMSGSNGSQEVVFGYSNNLPGSHYTKLSFNISNGAMDYSHAYINSSGMGTQTDLSTAEYHRSIDLRSFVSNIQGVKNMSGMRADSVFGWTGWSDSTANITPAVTFTSLSDSTISFLGILDSDVLYYKSFDPVSKIVIWQTHHAYMEYSTLIYNSSTNQFSFEQLSLSQWQRHHVRLQ